MMCNFLYIRTLLSFNALLFSLDAVFIMTFDLYIWIDMNKLPYKLMVLAVF